MRSKEGATKWHSVLRADHEARGVCRTCVQLHIAQAAYSSRGSDKKVQISSSTYREQGDCQGPGLGAAPARCLLGGLLQRYHCLYKGLYVENCDGRYRYQ